MIQRLLPAIYVCTLLVSFIFISPSSAKQETSGSCVQGLHPVRPGETTSVVHDFRCFDTFAEVIAYLSDNEVLVPHSMEPHELTEDIVKQITVASNRVTIGVQWKLPGYVTDRPNGFGTYTWYTTNPEVCTNGRRYAGGMPSGWDNVVQSAYGYSGCNTFEHWDGINQTGDSIFCMPGCPDMGTMNNKTSSWRLRA